MKRTYQEKGKLANAESWNVLFRYTRDELLKEGKPVISITKKKI